MQNPLCFLRNILFVCLCTHAHVSDANCAFGHCPILWGSYIQKSGKSLSFVIQQMYWQLLQIAKMYVCVCTVYFGTTKVVVKSHNSNTSLRLGHVSFKV